MKKYIAILLVTMTFASASVFAHTSLASSIPSDKAMLMKSPKTLVVNFGSDTRLVSLSIVDAKNEAVAIDFAPTMEASQSFSYELPTLIPSTYKVSWTIMGDDGHKMKGDFSFMVHAMDKMKDMKDMKVMKDKAIDHSQHNNH
jgi:hypothetical protein